MKRMPSDGHWRQNMKFHPATEGIIQRGEHGSQCRVNNPVQEKSTPNLFLFKWRFKNGDSTSGKIKKQTASPRCNILTHFF